jgi:hypothetical protein
MGGEGEGPNDRMAEAGMKANLRKSDKWALGRRLKLPHLIDETCVGHDSTPIIAMNGRPWMNSAAVFSDEIRLKVDEKTRSFMSASECDEAIFGILML